MPVSEVRAGVRQLFEKNRFVTDPKVIDVLILKGQQEYQETLNCWKQEPHILGILLENRNRPQQTFLQKFYEGTPFYRDLLLSFVDDALQVGMRKLLFLHQLACNIIEIHHLHLLGMMF